MFIQPKFPLKQTDFQSHKTFSLGPRLKCYELKEKSTDKLGGSFK